jgi:Uma2 family endonuclease
MGTKERVIVSTQFENVPDYGISLHLLPLANGDRLTRTEFERRWEAMPDLKCAELIEGIVYMAAAVRYKQHGQPHSQLHGCLYYYAAHTPGLEVADNTSVRLDLDNMPQPDLLLRIDERHGGQSRVSDEGYLEGAPELVAEVSASSSSLDLNDKLQVYRRHGVREYIVWRVLEQAIDWFVLREGHFIPLPLGEEQIYRSEFYPGLWLDVPALLRGDSQAMLKTLQLGLESDEHAGFRQQLGK